MTVRAPSMSAGTARAFDEPHPAVSNAAESGRRENQSVGNSFLRMEG